MAVVVTPATPGPSPFGRERALRAVAGVWNAGVRLRSNSTSVARRPVLAEPIRRHALGPVIMLWLRDAVALRKRFYPCMQRQSFP